MTDEHLLSPALPYDMSKRAKAALDNEQLRRAVRSATESRDAGRIDGCRDAFGDNYDDLRRHAGDIKQHALDHLDLYLDRFIENAERRGTVIHFATDAEEACRIGLEIAKNRGSTRCVKSKSMVTEEIHLLPALEAAGIHTVETDLGEFILQIDDDAPSHLVQPMIHKDRASVGRAFRRVLGTEYTDDPKALTVLARKHLREEYRRADLGVTGGNFLIAETGTVVICTNEGNADFVVSAPPVHIAFVGIEKVIPRMEDLSLYLKLLARSATSQEITIYTTLVHGPRLPDEPNGPTEVHVVLVDNGRTRLLEKSKRELLRCIRCAACLNACPVFRSVGGGHAYGAVYSGPIGAVITPLLKGLENYPDLPYASSLCGACSAACPVNIDIPKHLVAHRATMVETGRRPYRERWAMRLWAWTLKSAARTKWAGWMGRGFTRVIGESQPGVDYDDRSWIRHLPGPFATMFKHRDLPTPTSRSFRAWWDSRKDSP